MTVYGLPILATLALWWASTGAIMYAHSLGRRTFIYTMGIATVLVALAFWGLWATSGDTTPAGAYGAFCYGLIVWGWQIVSYYTGYLAGPRKEPCDPDCRGLARFVEAVRTSLYHELAALTGAVVMLALTVGTPNQIGVWTYIVLWWMHESAKLNLFFGVPNLGAEVLPRHLAYLESFMARRPMNMFFPFSVTISTVATVMLAQHALDAHDTPFETIGYTMLATLMALAVAEHWFLVAPLNANALFGAGSRRGANDLVASLEREFAALEPIGSKDKATIWSPRSWSAPLPELCDARSLAHVLELVAAGAFGEVDTVKGAMRTSANWVAFEINHSRAQMTPFEPRELSEPMLMATGKRFDRARLRAAFDRLRGVKQLHL